jgi:hypothetical protein
VPVSPENGETISEDTTMMTTADLFGSEGVLAMSTPCRIQPPMFQMMALVMLALIALDFMMVAMHLAQQV